MSYITESIEYGRTVRKVDLERFAADLAKAYANWLDVKVQHVKPDEYAHEHQSIMFGEDRIDLRSNVYALAGRVSVSITAPDVRHGDWSTYDKEQRTVDATINPNARSIGAIAKDIKKRVIDANKAALAKRRAHAKQQADNRAAIVRHADEMKVAFPTLDIRVNENEQRAQLYGGSHFVGYLNATLHADGSVTLDRLGSLPAETFRKIAALLQVTKKGGR